jgi:hypothetical protein
MDYARTFQLPSVIYISQFNESYGMWDIVWEKTLDPVEYEQDYFDAYRETRKQALNIVEDKLEENSDLRVKIIETDVSRIKRRVIWDEVWVSEYANKL